MYRKILCVDDNENFLETVKKYLSMQGYIAHPVSNSRQALEIIQNNHFDCILLDVKMPGVNGVDLLKISLQKNPDVPVIMISGQSNITTAVNAIKNGAYDFLEKPVDPDRLLITVQNAIAKKNLIEEKETIYHELIEKYKIIGVSKEIKQVIERINVVAKTKAKVLILGETGTGKELVARTLHHLSDRKGKPFIKVNCAAIPGELLESELFGYKKGAFTGAHSAKEGKFIAAEGGTLFLDEIGDLDLHLQAKLLRVLENDEVDVIGENLPRKIDVRILAATNQDLKKKVDEGSFREDLFHRLNVIKIWIPPLRERKDDIVPLIYYFLNEFNNYYNKKINSIEPKAEKILINYNWTGNVRELKNIVEKIVIFSKDDKITLKDVNNALGKELAEESKRILEEHSVPLRKAKEEFERKYILEVLEENDWKLSPTAKALGIDRTNLFKKMKKLGIAKNK